MKVSVIIPCYNVAGYIEDCLDSVYKQYYEPLEVIAVDNLSTDSTLQKLFEYKEKHSSLVIFQQLKKGASAARNLGLYHAKGDWIQFLDADDLLYPEKLEHQVSLFSSNPNNINFIAGASIHLFLNKQMINVYPKSDVFKGLFTNTIGNTCANLFTRKYLLDIGGWDESLHSSQEYDLMFRLLMKNENVLFDNKPYTIIRQRDSGQISQSDPSGRFERILQLHLRIENFLKTQKPEYYIDNKDFINQRIFDDIRILANYDLKLAFRYYKDVFLSRNHYPSVSPVTNNKYLALYKLFGFKNAERIKKYFKFNQN